MSDDERAFLRAAAAAPDDDLPRLVYADWLEEQGTEASAAHAAFVRLQVRRSRLAPADPDRADLREQEAALLRRHGRRWNAPLHRLLSRSGVRNAVAARRAPIRGWGYHRGMVGRVTVTADGLAQLPEAVLGLGPVELLDVLGWRVWGTEATVLERLLHALKAVAFRAPAIWHRDPQPEWFAPFRRVPVLDLRRVPFWQPVPRFHRWAAGGSVSPVVLFREPSSRPGAGGLVTRVVDPFEKWPALRPWYEDLTGERVDAAPYHAASR